MVSGGGYVYNRIRELGSKVEDRFHSLYQGYDGQKIVPGRLFTAINSHAFAYDICIAGLEAMDAKKANG